MLALRDAVPQTIPFARSGLATIRQGLLKIDARFVEKATRARIQFASAWPSEALSRLLADRFAASGP